MTHGIFVTGTNTGVGKTVVTAGLLRLLARQGVRAVGLKPVASGSAPLEPRGAAAQRRRPRTAGGRHAAGCATRT